MLSGIQTLFYRAFSRKKDLHGLLASIPLFSGLDLLEIRHLARYLYLRRYGRGEPVFRENTPGYALFIVHEGTVALASGNPEAPAAVFRNGECIGELALFTAARRRLSAVAETDVEIVVLFRHDFIEFSRRFPAAAVKILFSIARDFSERILEFAEALDNHPGAGNGNSRPPV